MNGLLVILSIFFSLYNSGSHVALAAAIFVWTKSIQASEEDGNEEAKQNAEEAGPHMR
jgi:hypothetical protein